MHVQAELPTLKLNRSALSGWFHLSSTAQEETAVALWKTGVVGAALAPGTSTKNPRIAIIPPIATLCTIRISLPQLYQTIKIKAAPRGGCIIEDRGGLETCGACLNIICDLNPHQVMYTPQSASISQSA
jgi:hypothetical protein